AAVVRSGVLQLIHSRRSHEPWRHDRIVVGRRLMIPPLVCAAEDSSHDNQYAEPQQIYGYDFERSIADRPTLNAVTSHEYQRSRSSETFVPAGERKSERLFDNRRAHDLIRQTGRLSDHLLAHALCIWIRIVPAPVPVAL